MKSVLALIALILPAHAAPSNDSFASAALLTGDYMTVAGTTVGATREVNEPAGGGNQSVWYKWVAPAYGFAEFGALFPNNAGDHKLEVFVGTGLNNLVPVGLDEETTEPRLSLNVGAGVTYYLRFATDWTSDAPASFNAYVDLDSSNFEQSLFKGTTYSNDNFSQAQLVSGKRVKVLGYPTAASREAGEPVETGENTIWWKWVAPTTGKTIFSTAGSHVDNKNVMTVGTGTRASNFVFKRVNWDSAGEIAINTKKGVTYYIALGETYYFGLDNLSYVLSIDHTSDGGKSSGKGVKARFLTVANDLLDESLIKGEFTTADITNYAVFIDEKKFQAYDPKISVVGKKVKWQFRLVKKTYSVSPWKSKVTVVGYKNSKVVAKVTKVFRLW
ncbi:MAG: hypothetical protein EOP84_04215 [Verrucomicrobiaceae bacterium]|nr:MAG: hypothetical protein EOP84_04215 [Verrucomicrobiaceae bacterium]